MIRSRTVCRKCRHYIMENWLGMLENVEELLKEVDNSKAGKIIKNQAWRWSSDLGLHRKDGIWKRACYERCPYELEHFMETKERQD